MIEYRLPLQMNQNELQALIHSVVYMPVKQLKFEVNCLTCEISNLL